MGANLGSQTDSASLVHDYPDFEKELGLPPGADIDAEILAAEHKADEELQSRQRDALPEPPPGIRPGSAAFRVFREEAYQAMRLQLQDMRYQLREYNELKRRQLEPIRKEYQQYEDEKKQAASASVPTQ